MRTSFFADTPTGIQVHSDRVVDPFEITADDVSVLDIAYHLSNLARFTGGADRSAAGDVYTVAQHSVLVSELCSGLPRNVKFAALLHDAPEFLLNDFAGPLKRNSHLGKVYKLLELRVACAVEAAAGLEFGMLRHPDVKRADDEAVHIEAWHLMRRPSWAQPCAWGKEFLIVPWSHVDAERRFLARYEELA